MRASWRIESIIVKVKAEPDKFEDEEFKEALEDKVEYFPYTLHLQTPRQAQF
jgi:hypothetical protein